MLAVEFLDQNIEIKFFLPIYGLVILLLVLLHLQIHIHAFFHGNVGFYLFIVSSKNTCHGYKFCSASSRFTIDTNFGMKIVK